MKVVKSHLKELVRRREDELGKRVSLRSIAAATGVNEYTVRGLYNNTLSEYPGASLAAICEYFNCTIGDLLSLEEVTNN